MVVFIFPVDTAKVAAEQMHAGTVEAAIKGLNLTIAKDAKPDYRETAKQVYENEEYKGASVIIVDPSLPFTADDIDPDFSFGNGTTIGAIILKTGELVECGWVVFQHADKTKVNTKLTNLKNLFQGS